MTLICELQYTYIHPVHKLLDLDRLINMHKGHGNGATLLFRAQAMCSSIHVGPSPHGTMNASALETETGLQ